MKVRTQKWPGNSYLLQGWGDQWWVWSCARWDPGSWEESHDDAQLGCLQWSKSPQVSPLSSLSICDSAPSKCRPETDFYPFCSRNGQEHILPFLLIHVSPNQLPTSLWGCFQRLLCISQPLTLPSIQPLSTQGAPGIWTCPSSESSPTAGRRGLLLKPCISTISEVGQSVQNLYRLFLALQL